ncbi:hypothetical protein ES705_31481 [subsurface metagenome]
MDTAASDILTFFYAIIAIISLIVFFVMASNIAKIRGELTTIRKQIAPDQKEHITLGERAAFAGDNKEAIRHFQNLRFDIKKFMDLKVPPTIYKDLDERAKKRIDQLKTN